ncbi:MAG: DUF1800 domain-containing protein [Verrucomicrobiota bacterium]
MRLYTSVWCLVLVSVFSLSCLRAEIVTLWQDDGNGKNLTGTYTSKYNGLKSGSQGSIVSDPANSTHGGVHAMRMNGANNGSTEWGALRMATSPYEIPGDMVWDDRIVPGVTEFTFTGQFFIPGNTTMDGQDTVYLLLRFFSATGEFSDQNFISVTSSFYDEFDDGYWINARVEGVIPAVNDIGEPIARIQPIVPVSDYEPNAGSNVFAYIDNVKLTVDIPPVPTLPPHQVVTNPTEMDMDSNGYPDIWESIYGASGLSPFLDEDGDGVSNGREAQSLTNPFDAQSRLELKVTPKGGDEFELSWPENVLRPSIVETSSDLGVTDPWTNAGLSSTMVGNEHYADVNLATSRQFFRARITESDGDSDDVPDWVEEHFGFSYLSGEGNSSGSPKSYDTDGDGNPDVTLSGDLASFNEIYLRTNPAEQLTDAQAARFLLQASFGPTYEDIQYLQQIGIEAWIDEQMSLEKTFTLPYVLAVKQDYNNGQTDPELDDYPSNSSIKLFGAGYSTSWARATIQGQDQLRQRVAWALSQVVVASMSATGLANQPQAAAHYYDQFIDEAFDSYEDLLNRVSRHALMGNYLSSLHNQKADLSIERFPDENFAREIMQLFTIGLWELNLDGTRKLDIHGEPIPTYGNEEITELARVFTGLGYSSSSFMGGYRDDGFYMTTPMKMFPNEHDFGSKTLVTGHVIPARAATQANGIQDIEDSVYHLVRHPNTGPFVCRQLIQFLVTSNPTPAYVARVSAVFQDNGSGEVGDMAAVVRAILLDPEARDPMNHLGTEYFGHLREPTIRTMHLARVMNLGRFPNLMWWDWGNYRADSLQGPMEAPSVFNYYRPDFRMRGEIAENQLDSPVFEITDSYAAIAFPNRLWSIAENGFRANNGGGNEYDFPPDWSDLLPLANNIDALLDRTSLLFCAGTMTSGTRNIIKTVLESTNNNTNRVELAVYLTLISPEGACLK